MSLNLLTCDSGVLFFRREKIKPAWLPIDHKLFDFWSMLYHTKQQPLLHLKFKIARLLIYSITIVRCYLLPTNLNKSSSKWIVKLSYDILVLLVMTCCRSNRHLNIAAANNTAHYIIVYVLRLLITFLRFVYQWETTAKNALY